LETKHKDDFEPYWQDEKDWLCIVEFLPTDGPEARLFAADIIGYLVGYANLTNTRSPALLGDSGASAYELLFSFSSPEEKNEFLNLVRSNGDMGKEYVAELTPPTTEEIRHASPLATVLPQDALTHAMLIAATLCAGTEMIALGKARVQSLPNVLETGSSRPWTSGHADTARMTLTPKEPLSKSRRLI
jgi:hypothetical protein